MIGGFLSLVGAHLFHASYDVVGGFLFAQTSFRSNWNEAWRGIGRPAECRHGISFLPSWESPVLSFVVVCITLFESTLLFSWEG